ncbi:hypothetical protein FIA58_006525 [Flavobacterium jejuense]|uniref:Uncharacterized protein n=1 Tax=Flavobacterium jejuense TaxID=1544455 RepID=A0ABX0INR6_9FLAO|nr:hypothetical protein [Flavobacterium jejuense]NHN25328.1 hypothetical protein [Flavobacterium jejuense]
MLYKSKNRNFNYKPRFSKENQDNSNGDFSSKNDFISEWKEVHKKNRKVKTALPIVTLILFLVLLLIGMYVLDSYIK